MEPRRRLDQIQDSRKSRIRDPRYAARTPATRILGILQKSNARNCKSATPATRSTPATLSKQLTVPLCYIIVYCTFCEVLSRTCTYAPLCTPVCTPLLPVHTGVHRQVHTLCTGVHSDDATVHTCALPHTRARAHRCAQGCTLVCTGLQGVDTGVHL